MKTPAPDSKQHEMNERGATGHHNHGTWEVRSIPHKKTVNLSNPNCIRQSPPWPKIKELRIK